MSGRERSGAGPADVAGAEGPGGHEAGPPTVDPKVPARVFLFVGVFLFGLGALYGATAYEESGTVMLLGGAGLGLWIGVYLWLQLRAGTSTDAAAVVVPDADTTPARGAVVEHEGLYLPHASAWPFAIGLGAATLANGLVLGLWVIVPGVTLMAIGIGGFVRQTRRRD